MADAKLKRTSTAQQIDRYMMDAELEADDELDLITFIVAAQAIKPGADQDELMRVFAENEGMELESGVQDKDQGMSQKIHSLLQQVGKGEKAKSMADFATLRSNQFSYEDGDTDEEDSAPVDRRRSVFQQAEFDAHANLAKTEQKMDIATEMLRQGIDPNVIQSVTGLTEEAFSALVTDAPSSPRKIKMLSMDQISEVIRLCDGGAEVIAQESELTHGLLVQLKDSLISMAASNQTTFADDSAMNMLRTVASSRGDDDDEEAFGEVKVDANEGEHEMPRTLTSPRFAAAMQDEAPEFYQVTFDKKPLGMSWNQTSDGKNLYVQDVLQGGLGMALGVQVGSVINAFNGVEVYGKGPEAIYLQFKTCSLPITIGFRKPVASSPNDPKVIMLKEVTGLETGTVIKLLHKFNGNVQAANEAFYIAKARTRQWIAKQKEQQQQAPQQQAKGAGNEKKKKKKGWWKKWTKQSQK